MASAPLPALKGFIRAVSDREVCREVATTATVGIVLQRLGVGVAGTKETPPVKSSGVSEATQEGTVQVTPDKPINRLAAVDLYRGLACTSMIIAHTQNLLLLAPQSFLDFQWAP